MRPATPQESAARQWLDRVSDREGGWTDHGAMHLPSGRLVFAALQNADTSKEIACYQDHVRVWSKASPGLEPQLVWLEAAGTPPHHLGPAISVTTEDMTLTLGDATRPGPADWSGLTGWVGKAGAVFAFSTGPHGYFDPAGFLIQHPGDDTFRLETVLDVEGVVSGYLIDQWGQRSGAGITTALDP